MKTIEVVIIHPTDPNGDFRAAISIHAITMVVEASSIDQRQRKEVKGVIHFMNGNAYATDSTLEELVQKLKEAESDIPKEED
jgi:hypothetical protein